MNKKMREIYLKMQGKLAEIKQLGDGDTEKIAGLLDELDGLEKEFELAKRLYETEKKYAENGAGEQGEEGNKPTNKATGFGVISKLLRGTALDDDEVALITPKTETQKALITGTSATHGENSLVPEDVRTAINELRRTYVSAKELCTVIPTESLTGSFVFEDGTPVGLTSFIDGGTVPAGDEPSFLTKTWTIGFYGKIIPISNVLSTTEKAGLMAYLNKWFIKNAIITENAAIFSSLKANKTPKGLVGWETLKTSINVDLDPSCKLGGFIVTNQSGFDYLDSEKDTTGRPILQPNPANATQKLFQDMPVKVFPDALLPDVDGKHPVFYGRTSDGCWFIELMGLLFASSAHAGFGQNQTQLRMIEGFATCEADKSAYCYGLISEPAAG